MPVTVSATTPAPGADSAMSAPMSAPMAAPMAAMTNVIPAAISALMPPIERAIYAVLKALIPLFLGDDKDPHAASAAARAALDAYNPQSFADYVAAARIIGFSLGAVGATAKALDPDLPEKRQYQCLTKANAFARFAQRAETALEKARRHRPAQTAQPQPHAETHPRPATPAAQPRRRDDTPAPRPSSQTPARTASPAQPQRQDSPAPTPVMAAPVMAAPTTTAPAKAAHSAPAPAHAAAIMAAPPSAAPIATTPRAAAPLAATLTDAAIEALLDSVLSDLPPAPARGAPAAKTASLRQSLLQGTAAIPAQGGR